MICDICHGRAELMCSDCGTVNKGVGMEMKSISRKHFEATANGVEFSEYDGQSPLQTQVGGQHYKKLKIQPIEYIQANGLGFHEGNVLKYITRWRDKDGIKDLEKARHYLDMLIEFEKGRV